MLRYIARALYSFCVWIVVRKHAHGVPNPAAKAKPGLLGGMAAPLVFVMGPFKFLTS